MLLIHLPRLSLKESMMIILGQQVLDTCVIQLSARSWKGSKESTITDSIAEAEYIEASNAAKEAVWIKKFIRELGVVPSITNPINLYCDNNGAIA